jgi:hypothetical protein
MQVDRIGRGHFWTADWRDTCFQAADIIYKVMASSFDIRVKLFTTTEYCVRARWQPGMLELRWHIGWHAPLSWMVDAADWHSQEGNIG